MPVVYCPENRYTFKPCYMNKLVLLSVLLFASLKLLAQEAQTGRIAIRITDASGKPLPYASVAVRAAADSALIKGQMSDEDGKCLFEKMKTGKYYIEASQMGYTSVRSAAFQLTEAGKTVTVPALALPTAPKNLKGVEVTAQKPYVERAEGKTILNVESSVTAAGNTVLDLLRRAPGVTVDKDDNLILKGKQGVTVMIDGKLTYLSNEALAELLKSMTAESVAQIEIITSPGAKYDAAGTSGIINIKTKKGQLTGFNGSINTSIGAGKYVFGNGGANLNWRTKKFNWFANLNAGEWNGFNTRLLIRRTGGAIPLNFQQDVYQTSRFLNRSMKTGFDYFITPKHTVGIMVTGYTNAFWRNAPSATQVANQGGVTDSILHTGLQGNNRFRNISYNLNYKWKIDTSGSELTMDADYAKFYNRMNTYLADSMVNAHSGATMKRSGIRTLPYTNISIKSFKADLVRVLDKTSKIEAGAKTSFVSTENNMRFDSLENGSFVPVLSQYDQFVYKENVLAAYLTYRKQINKTDFVLGLRLEQTTSDGNSISLKSRIKRTYLDYFPNVSVDHKFSDNHKLGLAFSRRINRPGYGQLNPFMFFLDKFTYFRGNSFLTPAYTQNTELTYMFKQKYIAVLGYSRSTDVINEFLMVNNETKVTISTNKNIGEQIMYSLNLTLPFDPVKWWNSNNNASLYFNQYRIRDSALAFNNEQFSSNFNSTNTFMLPKDYKLELSGWFESPNVYGIFRGRWMWGVSAGAQKQILKKKGTIKVNVNDIFASNRFRGQAEYGDVFLYVNNRWQNRTVNVSFSYRFGNNKIEGARERQTGSADESRRAGN